jgi:hypothetical protein
MDADQAIVSPSFDLVVPTGFRVRLRFRHFLDVDDTGDRAVVSLVQEGMGGTTLEIDDFTADVGGAPPVLVAVDAIPDVAVDGIEIPDGFFVNGPFRIELKLEGDGDDDAGRGWFVDDLKLIVEPEP